MKEKGAVDHDERVPWGIHGDGSAGGGSEEATRLVGIASAGRRGSRCIHNLGALHLVASVQESLPESRTHSSGADDADLCSTWEGAWG